LENEKGKLVSGGGLEFSNSGAESARLTSLFVTQISEDVLE
jgi:hypothetical protein